MSNTKVLLAALCAGFAAQGVSAQLGQKDSSAFNLNYEMDVDPSDPVSIDLDGNGGEDWFGGTVSGFTIPAISGGVATADQSQAFPLFRTDFGDDVTGSIQRTTILGDYTIEVSVWIDHDGGGLEPSPGGDDDIGFFALTLDHVNDTPSIRVNIDAEEINFDFDGNSPIATADNTDGFHTFRIAYDYTEVVVPGELEPDLSDDINDYYIWRDGVLLNTDINTPIAPTNGNANGNGTFFLGDSSGSLSGNWQLDYIRIDSTGAFAPDGGPMLDPADLDLDGDVDDADFGIAFAAFTGPNMGPSSNPAADLDTDGDVDDADFGIAFAAFTGPGGPASVPEPTSLALLGLGGLAVARRRRG